MSKLNMCAKRDRVANFQFHISLAQIQNVDENYRYNSQYGLLSYLDAINDYLLPFSPC